MSFQILNLISHREEILRFDGTLSLGSDQTIICFSGYVHLDAVVAGGVIADHQTLWEQISGPAVIWIGNPLNNLSISYQTTAGLDDKIFRFWIDKNTDHAIFKDITVYSTITEKVNLALGNSNIIFGNNTSANAIPASSVSAMPAPPNLVSLAGYSDIDSQNNWLYWNFTTQDLSTLSYVQVEEYVNGAWIVSQKISSTDKQFYFNAKANGIYQLRAFYLNGRIGQLYAGNALSVSRLLKHNAQCVDKVIPITSSKNVEVITSFITRTKKNADVLIDQVDSIYAQSSLQKIITVISRTKISYDPFLDPVNMLIHSQSRLVDLTSTVISKTRISIG